MTARLTVALLLGALAAGTYAHAACTPLDPTGEDTGCLPSGRQELQCERFVNKRTIIATTCVLKCHEKKAVNGFRNRPFDEEACENVCQSKFTDSLGLLKAGSCPACITQNQQNLFPSFEAAADGFNGSIFCDPSGPAFGGDEGGFVPGQVDVLKCELKFNRNVAKLVKCLGLKCHRHWVDFSFRGHPPFNEEACEETDPAGSCAARFAAANARLAGCPPCLSAAAQTAMFSTVEQAIDQRLGLAYCGSPSGAFVE
jgi:hypothetical protein